MSLSALADEYMADIQARKKPNTYRTVRFRLLRALRILGTTLRVGEVKKLHLAKIEQETAKAKLSPTTIRDTISSVQSVFNWAVEHGLLESTPLAQYRKPRGRRRRGVERSLRRAAARAFLGERFAKDRRR